MKRRMMTMSSLILLVAIRIKKRKKTRKTKISYSQLRSEVA